MTKMMKCGHAANATDGKGNPICAICIGIKSGAIEVVAEPDLTGRKASCAYNCGSERPSSTGLAFFEYRPDEDYDLYYCGCFGFD